MPNGVGVSLARNRRSPKRPSEPRLSGVQPEEDEVKIGREAYLVGRRLEQLLLNETRISPMVRHTFVSC